MEDDGGCRLSAGGEFGGAVNPKHTPVAPVQAGAQRLAVWHGRATHAFKSLGSCLRRNDEKSISFLLKAPFNMGLGVYLAIFRLTTIFGVSPDK